jgi:hypothetical protein
MRVEKSDARDFYEAEAVACGWNKRDLERQIHSHCYERILASRDKQGMLLEMYAGKKDKTLLPIDVLKDPYVLDFLGLPRVPKLCESHLEYVRMYEEQYRTQGDNPTIGLILCSEKNEAIARYSVLNESKQLFASKYMLYLPTEEELQRELQRERRLIEESILDEKD